MKISLVLALIVISFTSTAQEFTKAQSKKNKTLTNYIWRNTDSSGRSKAPDQLSFSTEKNGDRNHGWFTSFRGQLMVWWWADKKATTLIMAIKYSTFNWDTLSLANIRIDNKFFRADFTYSHFGHPEQGKCASLP